MNVDSDLLVAGTTVCNKVIQADGGFQTIANINLWGWIENNSGANPVLVNDDLSVTGDLSVKGTPMSGDWTKRRAKVCTAATSVPTFTTAPNVVDGVNLAVNDRVLVTNKAQDCGIYVVGTVGSGANGVWTRATDFTTSYDASGAGVVVSHGTSYGGTQWACSFKGSDTFGTTAQNWAITFLDTGWIALTLLNSWTAFDAAGATQRTPMYRKQQSRVYLKGIVTKATASGVIANLPTGFRPPATSVNEHHFPVVANSAFGSVAIANTGDLTWIAGSGAWLDLSSVSWPTG